MASGTGSSDRGYYLRANITQGQQDSTNNRTYCYASIELVATNQYFSNWTGEGNFQVNGGVVQYYGGKYYMTGTYTSITIGSWEGWVGHNSVGEATLSVYSLFNIPNGASYTPRNISVSYQETLPNYTRLPSKPSITLDSRDRGTINMTASSSVPSGAPAITSYTWEYSTNGSSWTSIAGQTTSTLNWTGATATTQYYIRVYATNTEGNSYSDSSALISAAPSQPIAATLSRDGTSISAVLSTPAANGSSLTTFTVQVDTVSSFDSLGLSTTSGILASPFAIPELSPDTTYYLRYKVGSTNRGDSDYSASSNVTIPPVPSGPTITTALTKQVRKVTIDWNAPSVSGGTTILGYQVEARYSEDGGSTWVNSFEQIATPAAGTTILETADLNIAKTYQFRVRAVTDVGLTAYSSTASLTEYNSIFISAYGYRHDGTNFNTAIQFAARYTGSSGDSIVVNGTTYTGWKTIENVKRYTGSEFISLTQ